MSGSLLRRLLAIGQAMRRSNAQVRRAFDDDGSRFPRDFYRPAVLLARWPNAF